MAAFLTMQQAADALGLSIYQVQQAYRSKRLPHRQIGRLVRFTQDDLDAFVERSRAARPATAAPTNAGRKR